MFRLPLWQHPGTLSDFISIWHFLCIALAAGQPQNFVLLLERAMWPYRAIPRHKHNNLDLEETFANTET